MLVLDEEIPYPLNSGKRIRTWNLLRHLARDHDITLLCYGRTDDPGVPLLENFGIRVVLVADLPPANSVRFYAGALANLVSAWPYSVSRHHTRRFSRALRGLLHDSKESYSPTLAAKDAASMGHRPDGVGHPENTERFDLVHCEWTPYASYMDAIGDLPVLIMAHNIETTVWQRRAEHSSHAAERVYMSLQAAKMARFEQRCFSRAARVVAVTAEEQQTAKKWGARATSLVSNGVDTEYLQPGPGAVEPESMLFLGSLDWQPNRDALLYLLREILPEIQAACPRANLKVVGRQPGTKLREQVEGLPGVEWVGEVPDIWPYFARAAVVLVPLRIGGGSRIKILESLSMAKAVVTTPVGAEGLEVVSGKQCLIADTPRDFAQAVVGLIETPERAAELGANGRALVVERYDWSSLAHDLGAAWVETCLPHSSQQMA